MGTLSYRYNGKSSSYPSEMGFADAKATLEKSAAYRQGLGIYPSLRVGRGKIDLCYTEGNMTVQVVYQHEPARDMIDTYCKGKMVCRPEFYSGRRAMHCDLNGKILDMLLDGVRREAGDEAASNFIQMVADVESLAATTFLLNFYELERNEWAWKETKPEETNAHGTDHPMVALGTVMSSLFGVSGPDETESIRREFLWKKHGQYKPNKRRQERDLFGFDAYVVRW